VSLSLNGKIVLLSENPQGNEKLVEELRGLFGHGTGTLESLGNNIDGGSSL